MPCLPDDGPVSRNTEDPTHPSSPPRLAHPADPSTRVPHPGSGYTSTYASHPACIAHPTSSAHDLSSTSISISIRGICPFCKTWTTFRGCFYALHSKFTITDPCGCSQQMVEDNNRNAPRRRTLGNIRFLSTGRHETVPGKAMELETPYECLPEMAACRFPVAKTSGSAYSLRARKTYRKSSGFLANVTPSREV